MLPIGVIPAVGLIRSLLFLFRSRSWILPSRKLFSPFLYYAFYWLSDILGIRIHGFNELVSFHSFCERICEHDVGIDPSHDVSGMRRHLILDSGFSNLLTFFSPQALSH